MLFVSVRQFSYAHDQARHLILVEVCQGVIQAVLGLKAGVERAHT
jgi:hypothetical protein